jgi:hypothetical protein
MRNFILRVMIGCLVLSLGTIGLFSQAITPEVSLDDYPAGFGSAENEWGQLNAAWAARFIGPSPSLVMSPIAPLYDSDVLTSFNPPGAPPGHILLLRFAPPPPQGASPYYVDAYSCNHTLMPPCGVIFVRFSVDRATGGTNPATDATWNQANLNEQPGDIFRTAGPGFTHCGNFIPLPIPMMPPPWTTYYGGPINLANGFPTGPAGTGNQGNMLLFDHAGVFNFLPNAAPYPQINQGTHDNVDAFNEWPFSMANPLNSAIFFSLHPASAAAWGFSAADILYCNQPGGLYWPATGVFAASWQMGLDNNADMPDSIDGLAVWDNGEQGLLEPGIDYAGFTLAPGSGTLTTLAGMGYQVSAASIFVTDFQGFFYLYLYATDIGVGNNPNPPLPFIQNVDINVDAMDLTIDPAPLPYTNPITRPIIDPVTKK